MARIEADKEDLMHEAVALVRRIEFRESTTSATPPATSTAMTAATIVVGFRGNGWLSIYFGSDPMYQFDEQGRLRRAFVGGLLFRTQGRTLARLTRQRADTETTLLRHDLDHAEMLAFRSETHAQLARLQTNLLEARLVESRRIPADDELLVADVLQTLTTVLQSPEFLAPAIPGRP